MMVRNYGGRYGLGGHALHTSFWQRYCYMPSPFHTYLLMRVEQSQVTITGRKGYVKRCKRRRVTGVFDSPLKGRRLLSVVWFTAGGYRGSQTHLKRRATPWVSLVGISFYVLMALVMVAFDSPPHEVPSNIGSSVF